MVQVSSTPVVLFILEGPQMIPLSHVARDSDFLGESSRLTVAPVTTYCLSNDQFHPRRSVEEPLHEEGEQQKSWWWGLPYCFGSVSAYL